MTPRKRPSTSATPWPLVLAGLGIILIALALGWVFWPRSAAPAPTEWPTSAPTISAPALPQTTPAPGVERISLADAKAAFDAGEAVFLDVRDAQSYAETHVVGALNIPINELPQRLGELNPTDRIITYCT